MDTHASETTPPRTHTIYDKIIDGIVYTPAHRTMLTIKDPQGRPVASISINGTYSVHAFDPNAKRGCGCRVGNPYTAEADHQEWQPLT
jgi:hypothetical protein